MRVMIGIPAYEEENNIGKLLSILLSDCLYENTDIYVVSSGSKDMTDQIVMLYSKKDPRVHLVLEEERKGKASALNILLKEAEKYDYVVYLGADNLPQRGAVSTLIDRLQRDDCIAVGGRPIPLNSEQSLTGFFAHLLWNLHHIVSLTSPKLSGEFMAFKAGKVSNLPPMIINDDMYLQSLFEVQGQKIEYCADAKVYLMGPRTIRDFIRQRERVYVGHRQIQSLSGRKVPTMRWHGLRRILEGCPFLGIKGTVYALLFLAFQMLAVLLSKWDMQRADLPYKWNIAKTTKTLDA